MQNIIKVSVRLNKSDNLEMFYYDEHKSLVSFCYEEGHNIVCLQYMYSCKKADIDISKAFIQKYNAGYEDRVQFIYAQKLKR